MSGNTKQKILIIRLSSFGDVILATAFVEAAKAKYPNADLYFLTKPEFKSVLENNPHIKKVFTINDKINLPFDLVFDLSVNLRSFFICLKLILKSRRSSFFSLKSNICCGFRVKSKIIRIPKNSFKRRILVYFKIFPPKIISIIEKYFKIFNKEIKTSKIYLTDNEKLQAKEILDYDKIRKYVGINPSAKWQNKRWILGKYVNVIDELLDRRIYVVLFGDKNDIFYNKKIVTGLTNNKEYLIDLTDKLDKRELFGVVSFLDLIFTTDSAILHIAQAFCVPVLAIFGPTVKEFGFWYPNNNDVLIDTDLTCRPCHLHGGNICPKGHFKCMRNITEAIVLENILLGINSEDR